ncbi:hypothetical protein GUITHDRAFT_120030 [Guillardia theta CCMP2712]|uniref:Plastid lipid-associated protein/fibrillin conserved domain-containing protein n=2 Tax=Guillardia theta TaxID=55529 RepID=L1ID71_GUITC|nr:hypothetical protein GUITHDRAFT_120030 [Guillardia theta CCMP2712]EKX33765.1 hypothetical protein GUITHDRAFT_120030 [Guillardia theta CCMP2712]|eukprot:XP_005820745.1 hypothetical protein GUITHDRAFT_120030 [Guillardia theta CCMP2712]
MSLGDDDAFSDAGFQDYIAKAPQRLLTHIREGTSDEESRTMIRKCIAELEQQQIFPFDVNFFNFAVSGDWQLLYSTSRLLSPDTNLKVRDIRSRIDGGARELVHQARWEYREDVTGQAEELRTRGLFEVKCSYNMSEAPSVPTRMIISVEELRLTPEPLNRPPKNPEALVGALQRALPKEFFDPDEALMDTTYLDPQVRLVCYLGKRFAGVRHVYCRPEPEKEVERWSTSE